MIFEDLITNLTNSDEDSWIRCEDKYGIKYVYKNNINIAIYVPDDEYYRYRITDVNHILNKNMMEKDDLKAQKVYIQYNGNNILQLDMYYDTYEHIYLPAQSKISKDDEVYYAPRWICNLAFFMSDGKYDYYDKLKMLEIKIKDVEY